MAYVVKAGDTFWQIAQALLGDGSRWRELMDANPDAVSRAGDPRTLQIGVTIMTPDEIAAASAPEPEPAPTPTPVEPAPEPTPPPAPAEPVPVTAPTGTITEKPADVDTGAAPVVATPQAIEYPGLMAGGTIISVQRSGLPDTYLYSFEYPKGSGSYVAWSFDSMEQIEQAVGPEWWKTIGHEQRSQDWVTNSVTMMEDIGAVTGVTGNFYAMMDAAAQEAAAESGISDPSLVGRMLNDPEMQQIMAQATFGDLSTEQVMAMKRNTSFWKDVLYPGIESLYGSTSEPEVAWLNYSRSVEDSLVALGYERDADGTFKSLVGEMLTMNIEDETFNRMTPTFVRAEQNMEYANTLSQWSERMTGQAIEFGEWFDVMDNATPAGLEEVVEAANLQYVADQRGVDVSAADISRLTQYGDLTEAEGAAAFTQYEEILTSLAGAIGPDARYDITREEILSLAGGISAPSGRSHEEIKRKAAQAARELGALDDQKIQFFVGYDPARGTPFRPGLNPLAPEGA